MPDQSDYNPNLPPNYIDNEESITLMDIILVLSRHIKVIIITPTILCTLMIIYVLFFTNLSYTSTAKIMSSSGSGGGGLSQAAGLAAQFGINIPNSQSEPKWVYPEIIKSRTLAKILLKRKFDSIEFGQQKSLLQILTYGNEIPEIGIDTLRIIAVEKLLNMINISEDRKTGILTLSINASEPSLASEINQALIEELDSHQRQYNKSKTSETRQFIDERILNTEKELQIAENKLKNFNDRNRRIENSPALQLEQQRLGREVIVLTGVFTTLKQQLETTKIEEVKESDYVILLDPPEIPIKPIDQNKRMKVILAGLLGIGLGIIIGFLREYFSSIKAEEMNKIKKIRMYLLQNISEMYPFSKKNNN